MSQIINLRTAKKHRARADAEKTAAANRAAHGQTKAQKQHKKAEAERAAKHLDAHKRDDDV
ncbi:MAG: DUF4169 family protein [Alphaproteobacteria bacterium]